MTAEHPLLRAYFKPGDVLTMALGILLTGALAHTLWQGGVADQVVIRSGGKLYRSVALSRNQEISVPGPLGNSLVVIRDRQVRIAVDPSPRQYCVRQGWLRHAGESAICLPNQVSIELVSGSKPFDSLNY